MGLNDVLPGNRHSDDGDEPSPGDLPHGDEPGAVSTPADDGEGTVGLEDRNGPGSPGANQGKTESMPPTPGHADPATGPDPASTGGPDLGDMNVSAADPQAPAHAAARPRDAASSTGGADAPRDGLAGHAPADVRPGVTPGSSTGTAAGPEGTGSRSQGRSSRVPGQQGATGPDEQVETDVAVSADRTRPINPPTALPREAEQADSGGVPVTSRTPFAGTSEDQPVVTGIRTPAEDGPGPE
jgi:hypothetical protein